MRKHLLSLAMVVPLSARAAHAATMLTFDPGYHGTGSGLTTGFPLSFQV